MEVPALDDRPSLYPDLRLDYEAFIVLSSSRPVGMVEQAIPISEIKSYMELFGIDDIEQRRLFLKRIRLMDSIYMDILAERRAKQTKAKNDPKVRNPRHGKRR